MANPFRPGRGGINRPSRKAKIDGQDVRLVRALDKSSVKHLIEPESIGDSLQAGGKYRELADLHETTEDHGLILRQPLGETQLLAVYPIFGETQTRKYRKVITKETYNRKTGITATVIDTDAIGDATIDAVITEPIKNAYGFVVGSRVVETVKVPAITVTNTHTIGKPLKTLLIPGSPFPTIDEQTRQGNRFQMVRPSSKRMTYEYETAIPDAVTYVDGEPLDFYPDKPAPDYDPTPYKTDAEVVDPLRTPAVEVVEVIAPRLALAYCEHTQLPIKFCAHCQDRAKP